MACGRSLARRYGALWDRLQARNGKQNGTRAVVEVLGLGREFDHNALRTAIAAKVSLGAYDMAAVVAMAAAI